MITPNKVVTLEASALGLIGFVMEQGPAQIGLTQLYARVSKHFSSVDQFLLAIDLLFILGRIEVDFTTRTVSYVD